MAAAYYLLLSVLLGTLVVALAVSDIKDVKKRILNRLGIDDDPNVYEQYDIVWPQSVFSPRTRRESMDKLIYLSMELFGRRLTAYLELKNMTSYGYETTLLKSSGNSFHVKSSPLDLQCHYRGRAELCKEENCSLGRAAISCCFDGGLHGFIKIAGENVKVMPLPRSLWNSISEAFGAHLAKRIAPSEMWDDLPETITDFETEDNEVPTSNLPRSWNLFQSIQGVSELRKSELDSSPEWASDISFSGDRVVLDLGIFVDQPMVTKLQKDYEDSRDQVNAILSAFNAVQIIYDDDSLGDVKVTIVIKRIILDQEGKMFKGNGDSEQYLKDICLYQDDLIKVVGVMNWDVLISLTGIDIYGVVADIVKDESYSKLHLPNGKIYGVAGLAYTGGACVFHKNCVVAEFWKGMENVDTIAHEVGHTLGMNHDGTKNNCSSLGGNIMSLSSKKQRVGWSRCSVKSFHNFLREDKGKCLEKDNVKSSNGVPMSRWMTNG